MKTKLSVFAVIAVLVGCGSDDVTRAHDAGTDHKIILVAQAGITSTIEPIPSNPSACNLNGSFLTVGDPSDVNDNAGIVPTGTGDVVIQCSVVPTSNGFQVDLEALITGGSAPATLHITGLLTPRSRDKNGAPNADSTMIQNIEMGLADSAKDLDQKTCFAQFVTVNAGAPGASLPSEADVFADDSGGRVWISVFCDDALNYLASGPSACATSATVRFENCASQ